MIINKLLSFPYGIVPAWITGNRLRILMYHSISENPNDPHALSPSEFDRQMEFLQYKRVISLPDGLDLLKTKESYKDTWIITFDDGLFDFYSNALPILRKYGYPVTMFIPTSLIGEVSIFKLLQTTTIYIPPPKQFC